MSVRLSSRAIEVSREGILHPATVTWRFDGDGFGMARDQGGGQRAYRLTSRGAESLVDTFEPVDPALVVAVAEQRAEFDRWYARAQEGGAGLTTSSSRERWEVLPIATSRALRIQSSQEVRSWE